MDALEMEDDLPAPMPSARAVDAGLPKRVARGLGGVLVESGPFRDYYPDMGAARAALSTSYPPQYCLDDMSAARAALSD